MPVLTTPPIRNQVATNDRDRFELCGESCVASALGESIDTVVNWLRTHEGERFVKNGTSGQSLVAYCASRGVSARIVYGRAADYVSGGVQRRHYSVVLVWSDHAGVPIPHAASQRLNVGGMDLRIASIALELAATVVTANTRDFTRVPGLSVVDWSV